MLIGFLWYLLGIKALQTHTGTYTGNMKNAMMKVGFKALIDSKYLTGGDYRYSPGNRLGEMGYCPAGS